MPRSVERIDTRLNQLETSYNEQAGLLAQILAHLPKNSKPFCKLICNGWGNKIIMWSEVCYPAAAQAGMYVVPTKVKQCKAYGFWR